MTKSGKRRNPFCKRQGFVWTCPLYPDGRFALGSSATCCSSCTTPTLASSTLMSQASTRASSKFSGIWRRHRSDARDDLHFKIYDTNWKSAEEGPDTVTRLLQQDIDAKFVQEFHADIAQAKKRWPEGFAVGRLSVSRTENRDPRLCLDSTTANVNAKVQIQEKSFNPCVEDITSAKVVSHPSEEVGLTMDVTNAHKRLRILEDEWDFNCSSTWASSTTTRCATSGQDSAPLGGAAWEQYSSASATSSCSFSMVGGSHDFLFRSEATTAPLLATCICCFLHLLCCPISWHNLRWDDK